MTPNLDAIKQRYKDVLSGEPCPAQGGRTMSFTPRDLVLRTDLRALIAHIRELRKENEELRARVAGLTKLADNATHTLRYRADFGAR